MVVIRDEWEGRQHVSARNDQQERGELQRNEDDLKIPCSPHEMSRKTDQPPGTFLRAEGSGLCLCGILTPCGRRWTEIGARVGARASSLTDLNTLDVSGETGTGLLLSADVRPDLQSCRGRGRITASVKPPGERKVQPFPR